MNQYEAEYSELDTLLAELTPEKEEDTDPKEAMNSFIALVKKYADFEELTPLMMQQHLNR